MRRSVGGASGTPPPTKRSKKCDAGGRTEASAPTNRIINFRRAAPMCAAARHPSHSQRRGTRAPPYGSIAGGAAANGGRGRIPPLRGTWGVRRVGDYGLPRRCAPRNDRVFGRTEASASTRDRKCGGCGQKCRGSTEAPRRSAGMDLIYKEYQKTKSIRKTRWGCGSRPRGSFAGGL